MLLELDQEHETKYMETKIGDEKIRSIPILEQIEDLFLQAFACIQEETNQSSTFCCILIIISFSQLTSIIFSEYLGLNVLDTFSWPLYAYSSSLGSFDLIYNFNSEAWYYIISYFFVILLLCHTIFLILVIIYLNKELAWIIGILNPIVYWSLLIPLSKIFFYILICKLETKNYMENLFDCNSILFTITVIIIFISFIILVVLTIVIAIFGNAINPFNIKTPFARFQSNFEIIYCIFRYIFIVISNLQIMAEVRNSILVWNMGFFFIIGTNSDYYSYMVAKVFEICVKSIRWISCVCILNEIVKNYIGYPYEGNSFLIVIGLLVIIKVSFSSDGVKDNFIISNIKQDKIRTELNFNKFIINLISHAK